MKWLVTPLLGAIFVVLLAGSIQSISADHESGTGIFKNEHEVELVTTENSNYQVYLQAVLRNGDGQLINVTENTSTAAYIPHEISDHMFDTLMGEKEIITIDNIKYEKVQNTVTSEAHQLPDYSSKGLPMLTYWRIEITAPIDGHGLTVIPFFQANAVLPLVVDDDVVTFRLTILRELN